MRNPYFLKGRSSDFSIHFLTAFGPLCCVRTFPVALEAAPWVFFLPKIQIAWKQRQVLNSLCPSGLAQWLMHPLGFWDEPTVPCDLGNANKNWGGHLWLISPRSYFLLIFCRHFRDSEEGLSRKAWTKREHWGYFMCGGRWDSRRRGSESWRSWHVRVHGPGSGRRWGVDGFLHKVAGRKLIRVRSCWRLAVRLCFINRKGGWESCSVLCFSQNKPPPRHKGELKWLG